MTARHASPLPTAAPPLSGEALARTAVESAQPDFGARERVAVVGGSRVARDAVQVRVGAAGYRVVAPRDHCEAHGLAHGCDALIYINRRAPDALKLLEELRQRQSDVCVIVVGPDPGAELVAMLLRAGAYDYVTVPLKAGRLEESLEQGLQMRRSFLEVRALSGKLQASNEALAKERDNLRQWNRNLVLLNRLAQSMTETLKAEEIVRMVQGRLDHIMPFDVLGIGWLKPERVWIHSPHHMDASAVEEQRRRLMAELERLPLSVRYPSGTALDLELAEEPCLVAPTHADVVVPMMIGAGQVGLLRLERHAGPAFQDHEVELLKIVAGSLALALRNAEAHSQVQNLAMTDGLTNLLNRRAFSTYVMREFKESERYGTPLGLIMLDLDHFKAINDRHGHLVGDRLLRDVAALLTGTLRAMDIVTRYGGEEFAVILRRCDLPQALQLAERIRAKVEGHAFTVNGTRIPLTMSLGVVVVPDAHIGTVDEFVAAADKTLYLAKTRGRNRVEVFESAAAVTGAGVTG